jgi:hypothetical protein
MIVGAQNDTEAAFHAYDSPLIPYSNPFPPP